MRFILLCLFLYQCDVLSSQNYFLPYLEDGKYGIADEEGKIIIQPKYEAAIPARGLYLFKVKQNGLWGFVNMKDEIIIPINMADAQAKNRYSFHLHGPTFNLAISPHAISKEEGPYEKSHLYAVYDGSVGQYYYVNPFVTNSLSGPYLEFYRIGKEDESFSNAAFTGLVRVPMLDKRINFIDTSGNLIFKSGIYDGHAISPNIILLEDEFDQVALYNVRTRTQTLFEKQTISYNYDYEFYAVKKEDSSGHFSQALMTLDGKQLLQGFQGRILMKHRLAVLEQQDSTRTIINTQGDTLFICKPCDLYFLSKPEGWFKIYQDHKFGIIDSLGRVIIESKFDYLDLDYMNEWIFTKDDASGLLDENYKIKWSLDSVKVSRWSAKDGLFLLTKGRGKGERQGMADSLGHIILPPVYSELNKYEEEGIIRIRKDTLYGIVNLRGEPVIPLMDTMLLVKTSNSNPGHYSTKSVYVYDAPRKESYELLRKPPVTVKKNANKEFFLADLKGNPLTGATYKYLDAIEDLTVPHGIFLAKHLNTDENDVINESGQSILPAGYDLERFNSDLVTKGGLVSVYNPGDIKALTTQSPSFKYRAGVIDANGHWIIGPDYLHIRVIRQQYIFTSHFDRVEFNLYDQNGKLIAKNSFLPREESAGNAASEFDRIVFGKPVDSLAFLQFIEKARKAKTYDELRKLIEESLPKFLEGSIDDKGKEVVPFEFQDVADFHYPLTTVISKDGDYSAVIDLNGKEVLRTSYPELKLVNGDSSLIMYREGKWYGLMDINGNIICLPMYLNIWKNKFCNVFVMVDSTSSYVAPPNDIHNRTRIGPSGSVQFWKPINFAYTVVEPYGSNIYYYYTFDKEMNPMQLFVGYGFYDRFMDMPLPPGYMTIQDNESSKEYVVNIKSGRKFKSPD